MMDNNTKVILDLSLIHISEPTRLGMISYAVFCLKKKNFAPPRKKTLGKIIHATAFYPVVLSYLSAANKILDFY